jgi:hypothetical protein
VKEDSLLQAPLNERTFIPIALDVPSPPAKPSRSFKDFMDKIDAAEVALKVFNRKTLYVLNARDSVLPDSLSTSQVIYFERSSTLIPLFLSFISALMKVVQLIASDWHFSRANDLFNPASWPQTKPQVSSDPDYPFIFLQDTLDPVNKLHDAEADLLRAHRYVATLILSHEKFPTELADFTLALSEFRAQAAKISSPIKTFFNSRLAFSYWSTEFDPRHTSLRQAPQVTQQQTEDLRYESHLNTRASRGRRRFQ